MDYSYEKLAIEKGFQTICGIDEAGRGPLAGPVYAAAVILPIDLEIEGLNDSKKLTEKKREALFDVICEKAISYSIGIATEQEIDEINILNATFLAMRRAVDGLSVKPDYALIDGNQHPKLSIPDETVVKGDGKSMSIAAASILAKSGVASPTFVPSARPPNSLMLSKLISLAPISSVILAAVSGMNDERSDAITLMLSNKL